MKAILITDENIRMLASRYNIEDVEDYLKVGLYLVTDFGITEVFVTLTEAKLNENYIRTGLELQNGFFEVKKI